MTANSALIQQLINTNPIKEQKHNIALKEKVMKLPSYLEE
jgi:hypothetical protein